MSEENTPAAEPENTAETEETAPGAPETETPEPDAGTADQGASGIESLPDWASAEITALRKESGGYRTKLREATEQLEAAKSPKELEDAKVRVAALEGDLHRERLARKFSLPDVVAARIQGSTDEEREEDAKVLAAAFAAASTPLGSGGLNPNSTTTPETPQALAAKVPRRY